MQENQSGDSAPVDPLVICGFPRPGEWVMVTRRSGDTSLARLGFKVDSIFRAAENMHWLTEDDKFADVAYDPIVSWSR